MPFPIRAALITCAAIPTLTHPAAAPTASNAPPSVVARVSLAEPGISPDGHEIAFVSGGAIWTVPAQGGEARLLVSQGATESRPLYSPDGKQLAFVSTRTGNGDVYVLTFATGALRQITFDDQPELVESWSRDGTWLYFSTTRDDISGMSDEFRVRASGSTPLPIAGDRYAAEFWGAPSPDGATLAITARGSSRSQWWRKGRSHIDESEIALVRDSAGIPVYTTLVPEGARNGWPMWSPDGAMIYFVSDRTGTANLWEQAATGGNPEQLTSFTNGRVVWPSIAANGSAIVFERDFGIWRYDVASRRATEVPITLRGAVAQPPAKHVTLTNGFAELSLAPDGKKVAFVAHGEVFAASARDGGDAARVTNTTAAEQDVQWSPDSRQLVYSSNRDGPWHLFVRDFTTGTDTRLTRGDANDVAPTWSPDGSHIAYLSGGTELRLVDVATHSDRVLATDHFGEPPFAGRNAMVFSPDGRWIAYLAHAGPRAFQNAYVVSVDGGAAHPVSFLANSYANALAWSRDGSYLLLEGGQRTENTQFARVDLVPRTPHFREDQFRDLFREQNPRENPQRRHEQTPPVRDTVAQQPDTQRVRTGVMRPPTTRIVFDGIRKRLTLLPMDINVRDIAISPDGKSALLTATSAGETNLYIYPLGDSAEHAVPKQITSTASSKRDPQWSPDGKDVFYLDRGRIAMISVASRATHTVNVSAEMDADFSREKMEVFTEAWSYLRDNFNRADMNGVDWNGVRDEYAPRIAGARTPDEMRRLLSLMVGELNSSHSGIGGGDREESFTGHLGLRFDRDEYEKTGHLRITEVIPLSPADVSGINAGEYLTSVNGVPIDAHTNLFHLLAHTIGHKTVLGLAASASATPREVAVEPVGAGTAKGLLYRAWVEQQRAYVARVSGGRLGYVHMYDMTEDALHQLYMDLDAENMTRDGVVIDVRNNNGGFVNAYALDVFSRRPYMTMQARGLPAAVTARTQLGQRALEKPTVLVTNQHTLSDGEDFTQGYRTLGLGKVVGEPTAGWIIYTSNRTLIDGTSVRIPFSRIRDLNGKDMELHPRPVDVEVLRKMGESYRGTDSQLDAAVQQLLSQLGSGRH